MIPLMDGSYKKFRKLGLLWGFTLNTFSKNVFSVTKDTGSK